MTERERLIGLIECEIDVKNAGINIWWLADYLLENGTIVPPVKVGDIVYGISRKQIIPMQIDTIQYTKRGIDIYGSNEECFGYSKIHLDINNQIGIKWYKTQKEAEKALKAEGKE